MYNRLSRVLWTMGQALLPGHLRALEESMLADSALRFSRQEMPGYGLYSLRWNETLLVEGVLSLEEMTLVLFSGLLLELKENAQVAPLNLNISGTTLVPVYVHVRCRHEDSGDRDAGQSTIKRDNVNCWRWLLELSSEQENPDTLESFRLAEFEKQPNGSWRLSSRFIPPLMSLGSVPFLKEELTGLVHKLEAYHYQLTQEIAAIYLSGADLVNAKQCLKSVVQIQRFLANLFTQISPHPYTVYEQLKCFYVDLCFYHNKTPQFATAPYRHEQLVDVFRETFGPLNDQLQLSQLRSPYLPLTQLGGIIQANLPASIREAKEIYLLVQKGEVTKAVGLDGCKIAAVTRIPIVHKFYLQGIPFKRMERVPFQNSFGPEVDIYQISPGEEWDYALDELAFGFYADPKFIETNFFLYWRSI
ncbi:MAG: type VI secretion system baseplate subunit TssK [Methylobacter sp.]